MESPTLHRITVCSIAQQCRGSTPFLGEEQSHECRIESGVRNVISSVTSYREIDSEGDG